MHFTLSDEDYFSYPDYGLEATLPAAGCCVNAPTGNLYSYIDSGVTLPAAGCCSDTSSVNLLSCLDSDDVANVSCSLDSVCDSVTIPAADSIIHNQGYIDKSCTVVTPPAAAYKPASQPHQRPPPGNPQTNLGLATFL